MPLVEQLVHQRCVQAGPLVLCLTPLKFPNVHSGYKPNCLTRVIPPLLMARTISSSLVKVLIAKELTFDGLFHLTLRLMTNQAWGSVSTGFRHYGGLTLGVVL